MIPRRLLIALPLAAALHAQPQRFAKAIETFLEHDKAAPPEKGKILFTGSSIFRQWESLAEDMAPLPVFNRAFGGSRTEDILFYMDRVVLPYEPRVIVYYCGSNDINANVPPEKIAANYREFVERVRAKLPETLVYYVSINRAPQKRDRWDKVDEANAAIREFSERGTGLGYIDVNPALFDASGEPLLDLYKPDKLHFHPHSYAGFTRIVKPVVEKAWDRVQAT